MVRITPTDTAWKDCPRADECCVNNCPLMDIQFQSSSNDPQSKCTFGKTGRLRIGKKWGLKDIGLTSREIAGRKKWDALSEEDKKSRISKLREKSPIVRLSEKGYAIVPKRKVMFDTHRQNSKHSDIEGYKENSMGGQDE